MPINTANKTVKAGSTTYFFNIKETQGGKLYLVITESRFKGEGVRKNGSKRKHEPGARQPGAGDGDGRDPGLDAG